MAGIAAAQVSERAPEHLSACQMAARCLVECDLADDFHVGFESELQAVSAGVRLPPQGWIEACAVIAGTPNPTQEQIVFSLVLIDDVFAGFFDRARPTCARFSKICEAYVDALNHEQTEQWDQRVGTHPTAADRRALPGLAKAVERQEASFLQVAEARCLGVASFNDDPLTRSAYARFYPEILDAFEKKHGHLIDEFWCGSIPAGVVRADRGELHLAANQIPAAAIALLDRCDDLYRTATEHLSEGEADFFRANIYGLATSVYGHVDEAAAEGVTLSKDHFQHEGERLAQLENQVTQRMERRAQRWYILGTVAGLVLISVVLAALSVFAKGNWQHLFEGAIFGATGALASVLFRMHRGALQVEAAQEARLVAMAAFVRPLTGALFGGIICALLLSTLLPIKVTSAEPDRFYYLATVAFIAGFAERWAPGLLELTGGKLSADVSPSPADEKVNPSA
jgi:hypothetical protein